MSKVPAGTPAPAADPTPTPPSTPTPTPSTSPIGPRQSLSSCSSEGGPDVKRVNARSLLVSDGEASPLAVDFPLADLHRQEAYSNILSAPDYTSELSVMSTRSLPLIRKDARNMTGTALDSQTGEYTEQSAPQPYGSTDGKAGPPDEPSARSGLEIPLKRAEARSILASVALPPSTQPTQHSTVSPKPAQSAVSPKLAQSTSPPKPTQLSVAFKLAENDPEKATRTLLNPPVAPTTQPPHQSTHISKSSPSTSLQKTQLSNSFQHKPTTQPAQTSSQLAAQSSVPPPKPAPRTATHDRKPKKSPGKKPASK